MKWNNSTFKLVATIFVSMFIFACHIPSSQPDRPSSPQQLSGIPEKSTLFPDSDKGRKNKVAHTGDIIKIPETPDVPPADIISQIQIGGSGGGENPTPNPNIPTSTPYVCTKYCVDPQNNFYIWLYGFDANQIVRAVIYNNNQGMSLSFLTEIVIQISPYGTFGFEMDNPDGKQLSIGVYDEKGNSLPIECTSEDLLKFSENTSAAIVTNEYAEVYAKPTGSPHDSLGSLAKGFKMVIDNGPICRYGRTLWHFTSEEDGSGWVAGDNIDPVIQ